MDWTNGVMDDNGNAISAVWERAYGLVARVPAYPVVGGLAGIVISEALIESSEYFSGMQLDNANRVIFGCVSYAFFSTLMSKLSLEKRLENKSKGDGFLGGGETCFILGNSLIPMVAGLYRSVSSEVEDAIRLIQSFI